MGNFGIKGVWKLDSGIRGRKATPKDQKFSPNIFLPERRNPKHNMFIAWTVFQIVRHILALTMMGSPANATEGIVPIGLNDKWLHGCLTCTVAGEVHYLYPVQEAWVADAGCELSDDIQKTVKTGIIYRLDFQPQDCYQAKPFKLMFSDDVWKYDPARHWVQDGKPEPSRPLIHSGPHKEVLRAAVNEIL